LFFLLKFTYVIYLTVSSCWRMYKNKHMYSKVYCPHVHYCAVVPIIYLTSSLLTCTITIHFQFDGNTFFESSRLYLKYQIVVVLWTLQHLNNKTINLKRTYLLTPWSRVLLEKLTVSQLVKKFPTFYGTRRFITTFTSARHLSLT